MWGGRKNKRQKEESKAGMERWLLSYADFITLLMVFFILMYSLSKVDLEKYTAIAQSLSVVLNGATMSIQDSKGPSIIKGNSGQQLPASVNQELINQKQLEEVQKQIQAFMEGEKLGNSEQSNLQTATKLDNYIEIIQQERGLVISLKDTMLFSSGSDELNPQAKYVMKQLGLVLVKIPNYIRIEGHTDDLPISTAKFPSNWELSALRAIAVMHVLQEEAGVSPERLSVVGYGEYRPLVPNINDANRARNRRVDVVILKKKYGDIEPPAAQSTTP
jgi:chemotaxis protein MotB